MQRHRVLLTFDRFFTDQQLPIHIAEERPQETTPPHSHEFSELVIICRGLGIHHLHHCEYPISAGDVFVIPRRCIHAYTNLRNLTLLNVLFHPALFKLPRPTRNGIRWSGPLSLPGLDVRKSGTAKGEARFRLGHDELRNVISAVREMEYEIATKRDGYVLAATGMFLRLVGQLVHRTVERRPCQHASQSEGVDRVIQHVESHYSDDLSLRDLARVASVAPSSLSRKFRKSCGLAPIQYLISVRLRQGCLLLRTTDASITDVAYRVGFADSNYFARQFRMLMKTTPSRYRRAYRSLDGSPGFTPPSQMARKGASASSGLGQRKAAV